MTYQYITIFLTFCLVSFMNLFIFRRDLRLIDNTSLIAQIKKFGKVTPAFIFTPEQIRPERNKYFCSNSVQFMIESLKDLNCQIGQYGGRLDYYYGENLRVLEEISQKIKINSIGFNTDYTPYAKSRDLQIIQWARQRKIPIIAEEDYCLYKLKQIKFMGKDGQPPTFTPFKMHCYENFEVPFPDPFREFQFQLSNEVKKLECNYDFENQSHKFYQHNENLAVKGGRKEALKILDNIKKLKNYFKDRNQPAKSATKLSAYLHFTNISIREVYHRVLDTFGGNHHLLFELHWREFFTYITHKFPQVLEKEKNLKEQFNQLKWNQNQEWLQRWKEGKTGVPFVDAGMRQMNVTGYMHNRTRQNVACFLVKDLMIDWREGQRYFAQKLVDYSPTQNSGNWQYVAGVGTDPREVRIFNPWLQAQKYDPNCQYIKKWIPELEQVPAKDILRWQKTCDKYLQKGIDYYSPMINHEDATTHSTKVYNFILNQKKQDSKRKGKKVYKAKQQYVEKKVSYV